MIRCAAALCVAAVLWQSPQFRSRVDTVVVYPSVRDGDGRLVRGLKKEDFLIQVDGLPVDVTTFSVETLPLNIVLLLDMSGSMTSQFLSVRESARRFVASLGRRDRMRIGTFGDEVALSPLMTSDAIILNRILSEELWPSGGTPMWRAIDLALESLANEPARRVIVVLTDGEDTSENPSGPVRNHARRADTMVYGIGLPGTGLASELRSLATLTGGAHFSLRDDEDLRKAFDGLIEELRSQYVVGFTPPTLDGRTHALRVRMRGNGLSVKAPSQVYLGERQ